MSEHLAAGITGDSTLVIQCTAGTDENQIRYGWNYAQLLAHGPRREALVPTPLMRAMEGGKLCRFEELTRMGSDVQDTLITVLSEKMMPVPELNTAVYAQRGFNIIATANNRDKGVNELSSALKRRFNVVVLPLPDNAAQEVEIIVKRVGEMAQSLDLPAPKNVADEVARVVAIFRELRSGSTEDGKVALKSPSGGLSTAEAIAVMIGGISQATFFNDGRLTPETLAANMLGAVVKDPVQDTAVLGEYLETVLKKRRGVESGPVQSIFEDPQHPYTIGLMGSVPSLGRRQGRLATIRGTVPPAELMPKGCRFTPRCPFSDARCGNELPPLGEIRPGHLARCWYAPLEQKRGAAA